MTKPHVGPCVAPPVMSITTPWVWPAAPSRTSARFEIRDSTEPVVLTLLRSLSLV